MRHIAYWLLPFVTLLSGCGREPDSNAGTVAAADANQAIEFEIIDGLDSEGRFRLSNHSSKTIAFDSTQTTPEGAQARDARLKCKPASSEQWDEGPRPMGDSPADRIEVPPGSQETVIVLWEPGLREHYAGGSCQVALGLQDGSIIHSAEFAL